MAYCNQIILNAVNHSKSGRKYELLNSKGFFFLKKSNVFMQIL